MRSAYELWESAVWFAAAAENSSDPRLGAPMMARARQLAQMADRSALREETDRDCDPVVP